MVPATAVTLRGGGVFVRDVPPFAFTWPLVVLCADPRSLTFDVHPRWVRSFARGFGSPSASAFSITLALDELLVVYVSRAQLVPITARGIECSFGVWRSRSLQPVTGQLQRCGVEVRHARFRTLSRLHRLDPRAHL